jgi:hypothetical protein
MKLAAVIVVLVSGLSGVSLAYGAGAGAGTVASRPSPLLDLAAAEVIVVPPRPRAYLDAEVTGDARGSRLVVVRVSDHARIYDGALSDFHLALGRVAQPERFWFSARNSAHARVTFAWATG